MPSNDAFFKEAKGAQTALKHAILKNYLATFAGATGTNSLSNRVGFLDGYAGPGEYVNQTTGVTHEGSPRIALTIAKNLTERQRNLECIFVEKKTKHFTTLRAIVDAAETPALAFKGDVKKHLASALEKFATLPALVFLDPFGAALDHDASIDTILKRPGDQPTELLLNFSVQTVRRAGSRIKEEEGTQGREATLATMDRWLGGDWWRPYFLDPSLNGDSDAADSAASRVTQEYARRVNRSTGCGVFSVDMRRSAGHKPLFTLMLFYPRALAAFKYNEAVSLAQDAWRTTMWGMDIDHAEREDEREMRMGTSRADEIREAFKADKEQYKLDDQRDRCRHFEQAANCLCGKGVLQGLRFCSRTGSNAPPAGRLVATSRSGSNRTRRGGKIGQGSHRATGSDIPRTEFLARWYASSAGPLRWLPLRRAVRYTGPAAS